MPPSFPSSGGRGAARASGDAAAFSPPLRLYEVTHRVCHVRAEPHLDAQGLGLKMQGQRVSCCEISVDGWVKLADDGWMATNLRGFQGLDEVMRPVEEVELGVEEHQAQGICCLEVVFAQVAVRSAPSRQAPAVGFRKQGELVFAHSQTFDGWMRLAGEDGWMLTAAPEHGALLRPRDAEAIRCLDLWALCDAWRAVRRARRCLGPQDVKALREAEESVLLMTSMDFEHHVETGNAGPLVEDGLLEEEDLEHSETWVRQRLFAHSLRRVLREEPPFKTLVPFFELSPRPPPLELFADALPDLVSEGSHRSHGSRGGGSHGSHGSHGSQEGDGEGAQVVILEHEGGTYVVGPDGTLYDPETREPVGVWNAETQQVEELPDMPCAMVQVGDETYVVGADGTVFDPTTEEPIGYMNPHTKEFEPIDPNAPTIITAEDFEDEGSHSEYEGRDPDEPYDALGWCERARELAKDQYWHQAAEAYGQALKCCENERAVELDFECDILRGRATCWRHLRDNRSLLKDAERILSYDDSDKQALEWRRAATEALRHLR